MPLKILKNEELFLFLYQKECVHSCDVVCSSIHSTEQTHKVSEGGQRKKMLQVIWWNRILNEQLLQEDEVDRQDLGWSILAITVAQNSIGYSVIQNWQDILAGHKCGGKFSTL